MIIKQDITKMILFDFLLLKGKMILFDFAVWKCIWFTFDQYVSPQHLLYQIKHSIFVRCLVVVTVAIKWGRVVPSGYGSLSILFCPLSIWLYVIHYRCHCHRAATAVIRHRDAQIPTDCNWLLTWWMHRWVPNLNRNIEKKNHKELEKKRARGHSSRVGGLWRGQG